ncbi:MAG: TonB-dependent receptor [Candidatus Delongbacteria bacterium]|nr:TonB-dependent receptor [Candidatus Delongbacteria bacterium]
MKGNLIRLLHLVILLGVGILTAVPAIWAANGKISGRVVDKETGEPLPGANVIIEGIWLDDIEVDMAVKLGAATDPEGYFVILNVDPGLYTLKASMIGYQPLAKQKLRVSMDRTIQINFPLAVSAINVEEQVVVAEKEVIKADISGTQESIVGERVDMTPTNRMDEFINKIKGVELKSTKDGNGLSIRGGDIRETDIRMDGVSMRDPRSDNSYLSVNSTTIEEIQVMTGGFQAKYGDMRSGLVNIVTKDGNRGKLNINVKMDMTPSGQKKYYGSNPWSEDSWIYKVFADTSRGDSSWCWLGTVGDTSVPLDLRSFKGWNKKNYGVNNYEAIGLPKALKLTPAQKRKLWLVQHPMYEPTDKKDVFTEGSISGGLPGGFIPWLGAYCDKTTFVLGFKYENTQFVFPIGPRDGYKDWNASLKLTTQISNNQKLSVHGMVAKINSITTSGSASSFGGALLDNSGRFGFMSNSEASVITQAGLLGGNEGYIQMYNKSRLQFYDIRYILGGLKYSHTLSPVTFYTLEAQFNYTDHKLTPYSCDPTDSSSWTTFDDSIRVLNYPKVGSPYASTNWCTDIVDMFWLYGGLQSEDSSYSWAGTIKGDLTTQWSRHHQIETGFSFRYSYLNVNSGTWMQSQKSWTPDSWSYYKEHPVDAALYFQDKLEFEGMVANIGFRADYFNPMKKAFDVSHPLDQDYSDIYNIIYNYMPGNFGSWERWVEFRELLDNPTGWPTKSSKGQFKISPRLGVSFPITVGSKLYFNYGYFYQRPNVSFLYNISVFPGGAIVPTPDLPMARTVAYEFGYEQRFLNNFLANVTMYYKDVKNEPLSRTYIDYNEEVSVSKYVADRYKDIRGIELRLEKNIGRFFTFWGSYEYMLVSTGQSGVSTVYENRIKANLETRDANLYTSNPAPSGNLTVDFHTPIKWGPALMGIHPLEGFTFSLFSEWRDGGRAIVNPYAADTAQKKIEIVDYTNFDFRASKQIKTKWASMEVVFTIKNLFNQKRLSYGNMTTSQYNQYVESLHLPYEEGDQHGNDKLGDWDKDYIYTGWFTAPLFLNPRQFYLGLRFNL